ncbi:MAG: hypothetical protein L3J93_04260, partial [Thermoplasmata archaeon]|nr:hypothetical protein [Thermoplasmata archaeon]
MSTPLPRPATEAPSDELLERTHRLRQELTRRGEFLAASWAEEAAHDLKSGRLSGWYYPPEGGAPGLVFYSVRGGRAFAHVHVETGSDGPMRALSLVRSVLHGLPEEVRRADVGLSGLTESEEVAFGGRLLAELGGSLLVRRSLER